MTNSTVNMLPEDLIPRPSTTTIWSSAVGTFLSLHIYPLLAGLGICANVLVILVWSAESGFNTNTFLMKCLALVDTILLVVKIPLYLKNPMDHWNYNRPAWLIIVRDYFRVMSVYTTLAVVFARWLIVCKPLTVQRLLTKRHTVVSYACIIIWSIMAGLPTALMFVGAFPDILADGVVQNMKSKEVLVLSTRGVSLALPIVILVVLNISMACIICRHKADCSLGQQRNPQRSSRCQRLVAAVVSVSLMTFLSYPLGFIGDIIGVFYENEEELLFYVIIDDLADLLEVLNSSVNIIFYLMFIEQFRTLCLNCFRRCYQCLRTRQSSECSTSGLYVVSGGGTESRQQLGSLTRISEQQQQSVHPC